jgi:flagellar hook protein FlgE
MSLYSSFYSSLSGLATNANALNVIGNNLSNINTVGFKGSNANFGDIFSSSLGGTGTAGNGDPIQFGLGVQVNSVNQNFAQASFQSTGSALNMALQGNGFFTLQTVKGQQVFSRAGNFSQNNAGYLVAPDGSNVMGWNRDSTIGSPTYGQVNTSAALAPVRIDAGTTASASATQNVRMGINLDSAAAIGATLTRPSRSTTARAIPRTFSSPTPRPARIPGPGRPPCQHRLPSLPEAAAPSTSVPLAISSHRSPIPPSASIGTTAPPRRRSPGTY